MVRKRASTTVSQQGVQNVVQHIIMDNEPYIFPMSDVEPEIPNMWNIAQGTLVDAGTAYATGLAVVPPTVQPLEEQMRRQRLYVKSYKCNYTLVNPTNGALRVSVYTCRCRHDMTDTILNLPWQTWNASLSLEDNTDNLLNFTLNGFAPYNSIASATLIGTKPFHSKGFNKRFGLIKQTHLNLDAGQISHYNTHVKYNKFMDWDDVYPSVFESVTNNAAGSLAATNKYLKDWTVVTMFVFHGQEGEGATVFSGANTASYSASQLNIFYEETTKFYRMPIRSQSIFLKNEIANNLAFDFKIVQDEDGDIVIPATT